MVDLFEKLRMEFGPLAKYSHLPDDYFFFPKLEGEIGPHMNFMGREVLPTIPKSGKPMRRHLHNMAWHRLWEPA